MKNNKSNKSDPISIDFLAKKSINKIKLLSSGEFLSGIPTGFTSLDHFIGGWQSSDLIVLSGATSMGKTSFAVKMASYVTQQINYAVAYFSLEMEALQITNRLISSNLEIPFQKLLSGNLEDYEWHLLHEYTEKIKNIPLYIDDTPEISISQLYEKCYKLKEDYDIQMIIVDNLHLVSIGNFKAETREQELSLICRKLKTLAKELDIAIILISQLSRSIRNHGRPQLADLKGSGAIEQTADIVSFIYRPEYYQILEDEEGNSLKGIAEIIIAKNRNGALDSIRLKWDGQYTRFSNLDESYFTGLDDSTFFDQMNNDEYSDETFSSKMSEFNSKDIDDVPF